MAADEIKIQLCGPFVVSIGGVRVEDRLPRRQGRLLLAYLVCRRGRPASRELLMEALWGERRPAKAPAALNALLSKVRGVIEPLRIEGRAELRLSLPATAEVDIETARRAIHTAESAIAEERWVDAWAPARAALHTGRREFMTGFEAPWIDEQRLELAQLRVAALEAVAAAGLGLGGVETAATARAGRELIRIEPYRESGYRYLIEALADAGNVAEALRVYEQLRELLRDELGIAPAPATQALHQRLLESRPI